MNPLYIYFYQKTYRTKKDGTAPIVARVTLDGERVEIPTGIFLEPNQWDQDKQRPKGRSASSIEVNAGLEVQKTKIRRAYNNLLESGNPTADDIKNAVTSKTKTKGIIELFNEHNTHFGQRVNAGDAAKGSLTKYNTVRDHFKEFLKKDVSIKKVTGETVNDFHHYLVTEKGVGHNTTVKYIRALGKVLRIAIRKGYISKDPTIHYDKSIRKKDPTFLNQDEVNKILKAEIDNESLDRIRDFFIFACYTGLAYSDIRNLEEGNIQSIRGKPWIIEERAKTDVVARVPLLKPALEIIDKYQEDRDIVGDGRIFPVPSNQKVNEYLKLVAAIAGINKKLTFHVARHTFATTITLANGVDLKSVSAMLGHSSIKMTEHYARVVDEKLDLDMQELEKKLSF